MDVVREDGGVFVVHNRARGQHGAVDGPVAQRIADAIKHTARKRDVQHVSFFTDDQRIFALDGGAPFIMMHNALVDASLPHAVIFDRFTVQILRGVTFVVRTEGDSGIVCDVEVHDVPTDPASGAILMSQTQRAIMDDAAKFISSLSA
jgi:hypothetical protein